MMAIVLSTVLHWPIFNQELSGNHLWRQTQTQWNIRNFYRNDSRIWNPRTSALNEDYDNTLKLEFPLMQWSIAMVHKSFKGNDSILITRSCLWLIFLLTIVGFYKTSQLLFQSKIIAAFSTWAFTFSPLLYYYSINPIPDNLALTFSVWYMYFIIRYIDSDKKQDLFFSAIFLSLSALCKLPFIIYGASIAVLFLIKYKENKKEIWTSILAYYSMALLPLICWYTHVIPNWENSITTKGILATSLYDLPLQKLFTYYISELIPFIILGPGSIILFIFGIFSIKSNKIFYKKYFFISLIPPLVLGLIYVLYELNVISNVHDYYFMPFLPLLFVCVGAGIGYLFKKSYLTSILLIFLLVSAPLFDYRYTQKKWSLEESYFNPDVLKYHEELKCIVPQNELCIYINDESRCIFSYFIDRQGFMFDKDYLPLHWIDDMMVQADVKYMYSDSRVVDESPEFLPYIDSLLLSRGTVRVFRLKQP